MVLLLCHGHSSKGKKHLKSGSCLNALNRSRNFSPTKKVVTCSKEGLFILFHILGVKNGTVFPIQLLMFYCCVCMYRDVKVTCGLTVRSSFADLSATKRPPAFYNALKGAGHEIRRSRHKAEVVSR